MKVIAIKAPGFGERKSSYLEDIAILTGAQVVKDEVGLSIDKVTQAQLRLQLAVSYVCMALDVFRQSCMSSATAPAGLVRWYELLLHPLLLTADCSNIQITKSSQHPFKRPGLVD